MPTSCQPILAIDTAASQCAVAILGQDIEIVRAQPQSRGQSETLLPMIQDIVAAAGLAMRDIAAIAVTTGPGSFTGLRIGLAAAQGLALSRSIPAIGIDSFAAFAASLPISASTDDMDRAVIIESRRAELYWQILSAEGAALTLAANSAVEDIAAALQGRKIILCGDACATLLHRLPNHIMIVQPDGPDPLAIARLGASRLATGIDVHPPSALYIRSADAKPASVGELGA